MKLAIFGIALAIVANPAHMVNGQVVRDPGLLTKPRSNIMVRLNNSMDPIITRIGSMTFPNRGAKRRAMTDACKNATGSWQAPVIEALRPYGGVDVRPYWVSNTIYVRNATPAVIQRLRGLPSVREIREERVYPLRPVGSRSPGAAPTGTEWGVTRIGAEEVWPFTRGEGVVVGVIDTGVRGTHEALADNFREEKGWFDPYFMSPGPTDNDGHGTHCTGTICGTTGTGVAPGAQWIACRGCDVNGCSESALLRCGEFMTCPTDPDGTNADCDMAPHIVSNSWGGGQGDDTFDDVINGWNEAGIVPVFAIMNEGPGCSTAQSPGDRPGVISVGATNINETVSDFSGRGPKVDPDGRVAPLIVAPGEQINSASNAGDGEYQILDGTSMATPHTAGAIALLLSQDPDLTMEEIGGLIFPTANRMLTPTGTACGANAETAYPNDVAGYGRLDISAAYNALNERLSR